MKEGWEYKKLGEVCEILDSRRKPITKNKRESGTIPYYGATGLLDYVKDFIFDEKLVLLGEDGAKWDAGEKSAYIIEGKSWVNNHAHALRPKRNLLVDELLVYYLNFSNLLPYITGVTVPKLNQEKMRSIEIPIGPVKEQQSIVDYLDSAFAKIDAMKANAEKALGEAKALFQASLKEMLEPKDGWEEKTIGDIFQTYAGGTPLKSGKSYYEGGTIPWIRSGEVCQKYIKECEMYITEDGLKSSSAKYYPINTILVAMYGATAAQVGILKFEATSNQAVCGILPHKDFVPEYIYYWFSKIQKKLAAQAQGGAQPNLSQVKIKKVLISYPPLSEQQSIVESLDSLKSKVDRLQVNYDKISKECDALKQAILRQVFE